MQNSRTIELLAPARDLATGLAAVRAGADAVYIGGPAFGARAAAGNSVEDIAALCSFAHEFGTKVHVAFNTIMDDDELLRAEKLSWELADAGADAFIIQDMGLLSCDLPPVELHASTQQDNSTPEKAEFLEKLGFSQIVLARELSIDSIKKIAAARGIVIMTDPDGAWLVIRNFIKGSIPKEQIKRAYVPPVYGKERRKRTSSKEGLLGVEGMRPEILLDALIKSGANVEGNASHKNAQITKADMFAKGLSGQAGSREKRLALISLLELPRNLSPDALLDILNILMTRDEFMALDIM